MPCTQHTNAGSFEIQLHGFNIDCALALTWILDLEGAPQDRDGDGWINSYVPDSACMAYLALSLKGVHSC